MCLAFVVSRCIEKYPLIVLCNRDEYYNRRAQPLHWWEKTDVLAGKDNESQGTWAGMNKEGRFSLLTFIRGPQERLSPEKRRGQIVPSLLSHEGTEEQAIKELSMSGKKYLGFNAICGTSNELFHYNNHTSKITELRSGIHGVSNADLNSAWYKVTRGKEFLRELLPVIRNSWSPDGLCEELFSTVLGDQDRAPLDQVQVTGRDPQRERELSSIFVETPGYGTLSSTIMLIDKHNRVIMAERSYDDEGSIVQTTSVSFYLVH